MDLLSLFARKHLHARGFSVSLAKDYGTSPLKNSREFPRFSSTVDCRRPNSSDRHDLFFFGRAQILDLLGFRVRQLLQLIQRALLLVFADLLILLQLLDGFLRIPASVAPRRAVLFQHFVPLLHNILASLFLL